MLGALGLLPVAGCLEGPSSGGPAYESREIDDGAVFAPGLQDETEEATFAALVTTADEVARFDLAAMPREADRAFVHDTDFATHYLGVVQVAALNSSMRLRVVDLKASTASLTVVLDREDPTPYSDDRVITTLLLRVSSAEYPVPDAINVELDIGERHVTISGD